MAEFYVEDKKHLKGYMFDSLAFRFQIYQKKAFQSDVEDIMYEKCCKENEAKLIVKKRHERDFMRFIQILDEAIGEHD